MNVWKRLFDLLDKYVLIMINLNKRLQTLEKMHRIEPEIPKFASELGNEYGKWFKKGR